MDNLTCVIQIIGNIHSFSIDTDDNKKYKYKFNSCVLHDKPCLIMRMKDMSDDVQNTIPHEQPTTNISNISNKRTLSSDTEQATEPESESESEYTTEEETQSVKRVRTTYEEPHHVKRLKLLMNFDYYNNDSEEMKGIGSITLDALDEIYKNKIYEECNGDMFKRISDGINQYNYKHKTKARANAVIKFISQKIE